MNALAPQIAQGKKNRNWLIEKLASFLPESELPPPPGIPNNVLSEPGTWRGLGEMALNFLMPEPEDTLMNPGVVRPNFRSPEQIKALRRIMAEEQRARGALREVEKPTWKRPEGLTPYEYLQLVKDKPLDELANYQNAPDPIDQILRGSWYHGMSENARKNIGATGYGVGSEKLIQNNELLDQMAQKLGRPDFETWRYSFDRRYPGNNREDAIRWMMKVIEDEYPTFLPSNAAFAQGFPLSRHDAASISNKLGEPAGVSLSLNPTVSGKFAADDNIFRVMPLYGGPPTERTVNLMTAEGRKALNDAYDAVANDVLNKTLADKNNSRFFRSNIGSLYAMYSPPQGIEHLLAGNYLIGNKLKASTTGAFNESLSRQLQNQGYRHILYNPQRWNEYEMLALDPKYALPLDYRPNQEYINVMKNRLGTLNNPPDHLTITPKASDALDNIRDIMVQNHSRLGDIYNERSWWERLSPDVKEILLQDNKDAERIIRKLKGEQ